MKSYGVTIQMKPLQQCFNMVIIIYCVVKLFDVWMKSFGVTISLADFCIVLFIS